MRQVLVDYARSTLRQKRGAGAARVVACDLDPDALLPGPVPGLGDAKVQRRVRRFGELADVHSFIFHTRVLQVSGALRDPGHRGGLRDEAVVQVLEENPVSQGDRQAGVLSDQWVQLGCRKRYQTDRLRLVTHPTSYFAWLPR